MIIGGIVPGIGVAGLKMNQGFAFDTLTTSTPATAENKNAKIKVASFLVHRQLERHSHYTFRSFASRSTLGTYAQAGSDSNRSPV